jgi:dienelactone hydrolase
MRQALVACVVLLFAATGSAQEIQKFQMRVGAGATSATEEFSITNTPAGHELTAKSVMKRGGGETTFTLRETLAPDWTAQHYEIEIAGALGQASVTADRKGDVFALAVKSPQGSPTREIPIKPRMVLLDNMLAAPLQVLLNATPGAPGSFSLIVPLQMVAVDGVMESAGPAAGTLDGKPVALAKVLLKLGGVTMEVYAEAGTNRLMRMFVPAQDAEIVREGFAMAGTTAPAPADLPPAGVTEREVKFQTAGGVSFPAALCLPKTPTPAPLVVLVQGSGPLDRDSTIGPNRPFRDLAWGLAARGVATLRYAKRTFAFPATYKGTLESESIDDAVDAVTFARTLPEVDRNNIFVLGHSLGGLAVAYVAERTPLRGLILAATAGRPLDLVIRDQIRIFNANAALSEAQQRQALQQQDEIMAKVRAGTATAGDLNGQGTPAMLRDVIVRDPIAELRKTTLPLLVLKGGNDAQTFQADFDALEALTKSRPGSEARLFPGLSHIFTAADGAADVDAIRKPAHVATDVVDAIAGWVARTSRR